MSKSVHFSEVKVGEMYVVDQGWHRRYLGKDLLILVVKQDNMPVAVGIPASEPFMVVDKFESSYTISLTLLIKEKIYTYTQHPSTQTRLVHLTQQEDSI